MPDMRLLLLFAVALLSACGSTVGPAGLARKQMPAAGSPDLAWRDIQGRCTVTTPWSRLSCRAVIRRSGAGDVRLVLLADEGLLLCDVAVTGGRCAVQTAIPDLRDQAPRLGLLAWQVWGSPGKVPGRWRDDIYEEPNGETLRLFGGDPLLLREVHGLGPTLSVGDYRPWQGGLLAQQGSLSGPGISVTLELHQPTPESAFSPRLNGVPGPGALPATP